MILKFMLIWNQNVKKKEIELVMISIYLIAAKVVTTRAGL